MEETAQNALQWKICPAKMYPKKAVFGWILILVVGFLISTTSIVLGICLTAILIATQAVFFFTTTYTIDKKGLVAKFPIRKKQYTWEQIRRVKYFKEACFLFTRKKPSNMDGWTGITVMYGDKRDEVIRVIKSHLLEGTAT
jgi:hypothetical protein